MQNPKSVNLAAYIVLLISIALGILVLFAFQPESESATSEQRITLGGDFTLTSANGPVSLHDYQGKGVVLFFGFTSCPDICPTSMAVLNQAVNMLPETEQNQVQGIFISVDPERDTPEKLAEYVAYFNDNFVGLTGTPAQVEKVVRQYGAYSRKVDLPDSELGYTVDHTARLYLIAPDGTLRDTSSHNSAPADLAEKLRQLLVSAPAQGE